MSKSNAVVSNIPATNRNNFVFTHLTARCVGPLCCSDPQFLVERIATCFTDFLQNTPQHRHFAPHQPRDVCTAGVKESNPKPVFSILIRFKNCVKKFADAV